MGKAWLLAVFAVAAVALAGCKYRGGIDEPLVRKASWFSYLNATDLREACAPGAPDRYRFVYNARYTRQVRSYEVTAGPGGEGRLVARALGPTKFHAVPLNDLQAPWRWRRSEAFLGPGDLDALHRSLEESGFFSGAPEGLRLYSEGFYWIGAGCRDGVFFFNAWRYPSPAFAGLTFPAFFSSRDQTGLPIAPPYPTYGREKLRPPGGKDPSLDEPRFTLQVRGQGLGGITEL